ncbi:MAG TPA: hypothetical protein VGC07_02770 [Granulicella sp.]
MKRLASVLALVLFLVSAGRAFAQQETPSAAGEITVRTVEVLDSNMYHANYSTNASVTKSSNPAIPKGSVAHLLMVRDPQTRLYSMQVTGIVINGALVPYSSGPATLPGGAGTKTANFFKMRGDGHTPSLGGGQVFLPAQSDINFVLGPPAQ